MHAQVLPTKLKHSIFTVATALLLLASLIFSACGGGGSTAQKKEALSDHLDKAQQLIQAGDFEAAYFHLNKALSLSPNDPDIHSNLGWVYLYTDRPVLAKEELDRLVAIAPENPDIHHLRGAIFNYLESPERAIENYEQAMAAYKETESPVPSQLYFDMATSFGALSRNDDALDVLNLGLKTVSKEDTLLRNNLLVELCATHYRKKDYKEAYQACKKAFDQTEDDEERQRIGNFINNLKLAQELEVGPEHTGLESSVSGQ